MKNQALSLIKNSVSAFCVLALAFTVFEPAIIGAATTGSQFTISQTVTAEISFATPASNVTMSPSLGGLTGGTANGGTQVVVTTNSLTGYTVTLQASSSLGMIGNASSTNFIPAMAASNTPSFSFTAPTNSAAFGYTVEASTTGDLSSTFKDNGSICGTGSADAANSCWLNASTTAVTIINRSLQTPSSGGTTTLKFRVIINSNPNPVIPNDVYVATTTLTATTQ
jgi:hypothetical protein